MFTGIFIQRIHKGFISYFNEPNNEWHGVCNPATKYSSQDKAQEVINKLEKQYPKDHFSILIL